MQLDPSVPFGYFGMTSTQHVLLGAMWALTVMPIAGFLGAVFLNWSQLLLESRPIRYWTAYKITTLSSMAALIFLVPTQLITTRLGSVGFLLDIVLSIVVIAVFYSRWVTTESDKPIGFEDAFWLSTLQTALWLLAAGVFFGFAMALQPKKTLWGIALAIACAALLVGAATMSMRRPVEPRPARRIEITWKTEDILALYRHAGEELDSGRRDDELWTLATVARPDPDQRRDWYLAERVKQLKQIAEEQLRREGIL